MLLTHTMYWLESAEWKEKIIILLFSTDVGVYLYSVRIQDDHFNLSNCLRKLNLNEIIYTTLYNLSV